MQDLRTVVLLRRQLRGEQPRTRALARPPRVAGSGRLRGARLSASLSCPFAARADGGLAVAGGRFRGGAVAARRRRIVGIGVAPPTCSASTPIEPLSPEIDHPDHTDGVPIRPARLDGCSHHIAAPALALVAVRP